MAAGTQRYRSYRKTPCEWCALRRECDDRRRHDVMVRFVCTMFDMAPYQCPDHEPVWHKGIEGVVP